MFLNCNNRESLLSFGPKDKMYSWYCLWLPCKWIVYLGTNPTRAWGQGSLLSLLKVGVSYFFLNCLAASAPAWNQGLANWMLQLDGQWYRVGVVRGHSHAAMEFSTGCQAVSTSGDSCTNGCCGVTVGCLGSCVFFSLLICSVNYQYASNKSLFWYLQAEPSLVQKKKEDTHFKKHLWCSNIIFSWFKSASLIKHTFK